MSDTLKMILFWVVLILLLAWMVTRNELLGLVLGVVGYCIAFWAVLKILDE